MNALMHLRSSINARQATLEYLRALEGRSGKSRKRQRDRDTKIEFLHPYKIHCKPSIEDEKRAMIEDSGGGQVFYINMGLSQ